MRFYMVRDMNNIPADGSVKIGQRAWDDADQTVFMFRRLNRISFRCGTRLAEWVWHSSGEIMYIVCSDLWWRINNRIVAAYVSLGHRYWANTSLRALRAAASPLLPGLRGEDWRPSGGVEIRCDILNLTICDIL